VNGLFVHAESATKVEVVLLDTLTELLAADEVAETLVIVVDTLPVEVALVVVELVVIFFVDDDAARATIIFPIWSSPHRYLLAGRLSAHDTDVNANRQTPASCCTRILAEAEYISKASKEER
jgi:hypothetical protein